MFTNNNYGTGSAQSVGGGSHPLRSQTGNKVEPYLRGPILWSWLRRAATLGGSALATGLAIHHLRSVKKCETVKTNLRTLGKVTGLSNKAIRNGLHELERANLVLVIRPQGCNPIIGIICGVPSSSRFAQTPSGPGPASAPFSPEASPDAPPPSSSSGPEAAAPYGRIAGPGPGPPSDDRPGGSRLPSRIPSPVISKPE